MKGNNRKEILPIIEKCATRVSGNITDIAKIFSFKSVNKDFDSLKSILPESGQGTIEYQIDELYKKSY